MQLLRPFLAAVLFIGAPPLTVAASSPARSMQPLFSAEECEVVPGLEGGWAAGALTYSIRKIHDNKYWMIDSEADSETGNRLAVELCAAHVDHHLFFDATFQLLRPNDEPTLPPEFVFGNVFAVNVLGGFWIPMHMIGRLEIAGNALHLSLLENQWLQDALNSRRVTVASAQDDDGEYFLTAPRKELKSFVTRYAQDPKAFADQGDYTRVPEGKLNAPH